MDIKETLNTFEQDEAYCGNFNIWEVCFKTDRLFRKYEKKMRPKGYFLTVVLGDRFNKLV